MVEFSHSDPGLWSEALSSYPSQIEALGKPNLVSLDDFYRNELPPLLHKRNPSPYITTSELSKLMQWKLIAENGGRGYWTLFHRWMNRSSNWPLRRPSNAFLIFPKPYLSLLRSKASVRLLPRRFWPPTRRMLRLSCPTR
ncbi:hypothetical protein SDJN02_13139 [Cucurbita argyrosperma subsp. argyrosperma]|nr:hypothetical protein SDJN02_13139 [Cucurbita argyrosperma subsp. argyrosperma]